MNERPLIVTVVAGLVALGALVTLGALWSGSEAGRAFAEAFTATYESSMLVYLVAGTMLVCGVGMFLGWNLARIVYVFWMAWGVFEGLFLLDEQHYSLPVIGMVVVFAVLLFTPQANAWFKRDSA